MDYELVKPFLASLARHCLTAAGAYMGFTGSEETQFVGAGMVLAGLAWAWWQKVGQDKLVALMAKMRPVAPQNATTGQAVKAAKAAAVTEAVVKVLLIAFALSLFLPMGAHAQTVKKPAPTLNLPIDPLHLNGTTITGNAEVDLKALWAKIVSASATDLSYASAMAAAAATPSAKQRKQCWDAIAAINAEVNGAGLKDDKGNPLNKPSPSLFADIESQAEILDNLSPQGALFTSCAAAAEMAKADVLQFVNAIVTGAAGLGAAGIAIP